MVCNLFGNPEPIDAVRKLANEAGAAVLDDAAQSLGARGAEGPTGARGDIGILSFARGKPLSGLGGGAIVWHGQAAIDAPLQTRARGAAILRALAYNAALTGPIFRVLSAVPSLGIGRTVFEPGFPQGGIDGASVALAAALLPDMHAALARRAGIAERLSARVRAETKFTVLLPPVGTTAAFPRLALLAPSAGIRNDVLGRLESLGTGVSTFYPDSLACLSRLTPALSASSCFTGATDLAARLLTLPTHGRLTGRLLDEVLESLHSSFRKMK